MFFLFCSFCFPLGCLLFTAPFSLRSFYNRHLYIVLFEGYLFPLNLDDFDYISKPRHQKFTKENAFYNFWLITVNPFHFLTCFCFQTICQKNNRTNPLPPLINVAGCQNMCSFWFLLLPCFWNIDLGGGGIYSLCFWYRESFFSCPTIFFDWL